MPNLGDKTRYILHYRNLQLYLQLGMPLKKSYRVLHFDQSPWIESYIRENTEICKQEKRTFEQELYKLLNNSVFRKTLGNLRKRVDVKLVRPTEGEKLRKLVAKPSLNRRVIFGEAGDLAAVHMHNSRRLLNRPAYVGTSILDLSKHLMYDWYYNHLKAQYVDRSDLLYMDTDSLVLEVQSEDVYAEMACNADQYDTSNYPKDHPLYSTVKKKGALEE